MALTGYTERRGTASNNTLLAGRDAVTYGLAGNDTLVSSGANSFLVGGGGNDTYQIGSFGLKFIYDAGGGTRDTFVDSTSFSIGTRFTAELDGRHLLIADFFGNYTYLMDWRSGDTRIEFVQTGGRTLTNDQYYASLQTSPTHLGNSAIDTYIAGGSSIFNTFLTEVSARSSAFEAGRTPPEFGSTGNDSWGGTSGNDSVFGLAGNDTMSAAAGNDVVYGNQGLDLLVGGDGNDTLFGGQNGGTAGADGVLRQGADTIDGGNGDDAIYGNHGGDLLSGGGDQDHLYGGQDADTLYGGAGTDWLIGGLGRDVLVGGPGHDVFAFGAPAQSAFNGEVDIIADFSRSENDRINLAGIDANQVLAGDQSFSWRGNTVTGAGFSVWFNHSNGDTFLYASTTASSTPNFMVQLTGVVSLTTEYVWL